MKLGFHREASEEYAEAALFYEARRPGLGAEFIAEVELAQQRILAGPKHWPKIEPEIRRCLVNRFPYSLLYAMDRDGITIVALMHQSRHPGYWHSRVH
jgi:hypothetical protein